MTAVEPGLVGWGLALVVPLALVSCTSFTKISMVLAALRLGLGAQGVLPLGAVTALSVLLTALTMSPTVTAIASEVLLRGGLGALSGVSFDDLRALAQPLLAFVSRHADPSEVAFVAQTSALDASHPLVLAAAFLLTELIEGLGMAVLVLLPFVVVDLLAAYALAVAGLVQVQPQLVTIPLKALLFLAVGGFDTLVGGLAEHYD